LVKTAGPLCTLLPFSELVSEIERNLYFILATLLWGSFVAEI
jgi:hypothetical protein